MMILILSLALVGAPLFSQEQQALKLKPLVLQNNNNVVVVSDNTHEQVKNPSSGLCEKNIDKMAWVLRCIGVMRSVRECRKDEAFFVHKVEKEALPVLRSQVDAEGGAAPQTLQARYLNAKMIHESFIQIDADGLSYFYRKVLLTLAVHLASYVQFSQFRKIETKAWEAYVSPRSGREPHYQFNIYGLLNHKFIFIVMPPVITYVSTASLELLFSAIFSGLGIDWATSRIRKEIIETLTSAFLCEYICYLVYIALLHHTVGKESENLNKDEKRKLEEKVRNAVVKKLLA